MQSGIDRDEPDLIADVRSALRQPDPWDLLALVSGLLTVVDARTKDPFEPEPAAPTLGLHELATSFMEVRIPGTTALLTVLAEMVDDDELVPKIRGELAARGDKLPEWLERLGPLHVEAVLESCHVLGDGDQILVGVQTAAGHAFTAVLYIDHNVGTIVKDGFPIWEPIETAAAVLRKVIDADPDTVIRPLDPADARARATEAIKRAAMTYPRFESETWPMCRPLVEWVLRQLPKDGRGYERPEWDDRARERLTDAFFASPFGRGLDGEDRDLFGSILWFACDYGPGDPLRWSPVAVEMLLGDWLPRKIVAEAAYLGRAPDLLRAFVRYCHAERGIRAELTAETLAAVDEMEREYQRAIRSPRPQGPMALLAAMGVLHGSDMAGWDIEVEDSAGLILDQMCLTVGGEETLWRLDDEPLPNEAFDWRVVPEDAHERVADVLALIDRCCEELFDIECRTVARRLLADIVAVDAGIFCRRGRVETAAAAIVWIVARANYRFSWHRGGLTVKRMLAWFGLTGSVTQRADTMLRAIRPDAGYWVYPEALGTVRYLTGACRRELIDQRDRLADRRALGQDHGRFEVLDDFDEPLDDDVLRTFGA